MAGVGFSGASLFHSHYLHTLMLLEPGRDYHYNFCPKGSSLLPRSGICTFRNYSKDDDTVRITTVASQHGPMKFVAIGQTITFCESQYGEYEYCTGTFLRFAETATEPIPTSVYMERDVAEVAPLATMVAKGIIVELKHGNKQAKRLVGEVVGEFKNPTFVVKCEDGLIRIWPEHSVSKYIGVEYWKQRALAAETKLRGEV